MEIKHDLTTTREFIFDLDDELSPVRHQATIRTNAGLETIRLQCNQVLFKIQKFCFMKVHLKMLSTKWRTFCPGLNMLHNITVIIDIVKWQSHACF